MIKGQFVQFDDIRIPALVIRVATLTDLFPDLELPAMKTLAFVDVLSDFLVAIKAERGLAFPVCTIMALGTFMFELGMPLDQWARHDQGFDGCRLASC